MMLQKNQKEWKIFGIDENRLEKLDIQSDVKAGDGLVGEEMARLL